MVILTELPCFLSLLVLFYKDCLILKRNDFILIILQILFQRWLYNTNSVISLVIAGISFMQTLVIAGISAE